MTSRRAFLKDMALGAAGVAATEWGARPGVAADARPNILFIMSDDHAAHAISAYGSKVNQTPQIDWSGCGRS